MTHPSPVLFASACALLLVACGETAAPPSEETYSKKAMEEETGDGTMMDHAGHETGSDIGHASGVIKSISNDAGFVTIDHGPVSGIGMDAMTMGFDLMGEADLSGLSEGDEVSFMLKRGRDGSYRVMAICNTAAGGEDCLDTMMEH